MRNNLANRVNKYIVTKKHKLVIMKLFEAGAPISEIAHVFHRSPTTINNLIREAKKAKVA